VKIPYPIPDVELKRFRIESDKRKTTVLVITTSNTSSSGRKKIKKILTYKFSLDSDKEALEVFGLIF
jgi:hypothetical protein